jgi:hypothetical protein
MRITLGVIFICVWTTSSAQTSSGQEAMSVCELYAHAKDFDGLRVGVRARLKMETQTLQDDQCPKVRIVVDLGRKPPPKTCEYTGLAKPLGCPNDPRKYIDGTFWGVFHASEEADVGRLTLNSTMEQIYYTTLAPDAGT